jgi:hypothetical protein
VIKVKNNKKIFISYVRNDSEKYINEIKKKLTDMQFDPITEMVDLTKKYDDQGIRTIIRDKYMKDCDYVLVLLSENSWKRKHIDWEISAALRDSKFNPRKAVVTVFMPSYGEMFIRNTSKTPQRLIGNIKSGYIQTITYNQFLTTNSNDVFEKAHEILKNGAILPINNMPLRRRNTE